MEAHNTGYYPVDLTWSDPYMRHFTPNRPGYNLHYFFSFEYVIDGHKKMTRTGFHS